MRKERDCQIVTKRADGYEVLHYVVLKGDVCGACGAELTLALAAVLVVGEHAVAHCERCGKEQEVRETALTSLAESLDESRCRSTLLLFGDAPEPFLAHYTRATLVFSAYQRYTRGVVEGFPVTTAAVEGSKASKRPDPELAQVYDELCAESYLELRDAVCALCRAFLAPPPHALLAQDG